MEALYTLLGFAMAMWLLTGELERRGRLNVERHLVLLLLRTEKGKEFIKGVAKRRVWTPIGTLSVVVGVLGMVAGFAMLAYVFYTTYVVKQPLEGGGVQLVIPGVTIPFWYGILGLLTVLVVHEFAHGILAMRENVTIKSLGVVLLAGIPVGAFVEPDEEELKAKPRLSKLRVYAMGSFGNLVLALLALQTVGFISDNAFSAGQLYIVNVFDNSPASGVLEKGMIIEEISGIKISGQSEFLDTLKSVKPGEVVTIKTDKGSFPLKTAPREKEPERSFIGITVASHAGVKSGVSDYLGESLPFILYWSFYWIALLNVGIGIMNLAPLHFGIAATDGHLILKELLAGVIREESAEKISLFISSTLMLSVLFMLLVPPWPTL